jgi:hypothetical protein
VVFSYAGDPGTNTSRTVADCGRAKIPHFSHISMVRDLSDKSFCSYGKVFRFSLLTEGVSLVVGREYFRSVICVFSIAHIL